MYKYHSIPTLCSILSSKLASLSTWLSKDLVLIPETKNANSPVKVQHNKGEGVVCTCISFSTIIQSKLFLNNPFSSYLYQIGQTINHLITF